MATVSSVNLRSGLTLSYAEQGEATDVALVLLPGPTDSWRSYQPVLDQLPPSLHTVAVSLRGDAGLQEFVRSVVAGLDDPISPDLVRSFVIDTSSDGVTPELLDRLIDEVLKVPARVWTETFAALVDYDDIVSLSLIDAPALLIWGECGAVVSRDMQDQLVSDMPTVRLVVYAGTGHTPRWEDPSRFSRDVANFAAQLLPALD